MGWKSPGIEHLSADNQDFDHSCHHHHHHHHHYQYHHYHHHQQHQHWTNLLGSQSMSQNMLQDNKKVLKICKSLDNIFDNILKDIQDSVIFKCGPFSSDVIR